MGPRRARCRQLGAIAARGCLLSLLLLLVSACSLPTVTPLPPPPPLPAPTLTDIAVEPPWVNLAAGEIYRPAIRAVYSDGSEADVTGAEAGTTYHSSDEANVVVDDEGVLRVSDSAVTGEQAVMIIRHGDFDVALVTTVKNVLAKTVALNEAELPVVLNYQSIDAVVNKQRNLLASYVPPDLVRVNVPHTGDPKQLRQPAALALEQLFASAQSDGFALVAASGYRSYATQQAIFERNVATHGFVAASRFSAQPGQSEHQTGLAMDVTTAGVGYRLVQEFGRTAEGRWLADNAARFGFIIRYPQGREEITGYTYEPWHLRYVGEWLAREIDTLGITMEEYLAE